MARKRKKRIPAGTYYDDKLARYVEPGDPAYDKMRFTRAVNGSVAKALQERKR